MVSFPVTDGPHNDAWKSLLRPCFAVIDEVIRDHGVAFPIQIGGGSMLLRRYRHRKSKDLDLFVTDIRRGVRRPHIARHILGCKHGDALAQWRWPHMRPAGCIDGSASIQASPAAVFCLPQEPLALRAGHYTRNDEPKQPRWWKRFVTLAITR